MKKKFTSILIALAMLLILVPEAVFAAEITVKDINGSIYTLQVETGDSIDNVKAKIQEQTGIDPADQILIYAGKQLEDGRTLYDYGITGGERIHLVKKVSSSCDHTWSKSYTVDKEATQTEHGQKSIHCTSCDAMQEGSEQVIHYMKHYKKSGGYLKNGTEYDYCTICEIKQNIKTLAGYSSYVIKNIKICRCSKSFKIWWAKASKTNQKKMTGYQIRYSTKSSMKNAKYAYAGKTSRCKKVTKLGKHKKYYIQVRNYMKKSGTTYCSKWSGKKSVRTK